MEIFNNQKRSGYEEIVSYGPRWWTEYKEMDANYRFAGWTLDLMAYWLERIILNQFPAYADEQAIAVFEKILAIDPDPEDSLEERRRTVAAYYSGTGKLSASTIKSIIKSYTGCESELWWNGLILQIRIFLEDDAQFSAKKIYSIINRRIPGHIGFSIRDVLCVFLLFEEIKFAREKYRMPFTWWGGLMDGSYLLNGSALMCTEYPTRFLPRFPIIAQQEEDFEFYYPGWKFYINCHEQFLPGVVYQMPITWWNVFTNSEFPPYFRQGYTAVCAISENFPFCSTNLLTEIKNMEFGQISASHRVLLNWWEELRTLDGDENLNGLHELNQDTPPAWTREIYSVNILAEETFTVSMYVPGDAKLLDGSALLDGTIKLNSGREEL